MRIMSAIEFKFVPEFVLPASVNIPMLGLRNASSFYNLEAAYQFYFAILLQVLVQKKNILNYGVSTVMH
jgi:hypothetical protein